MQNLKSLALKTACAFEVSFSHVIRDRATSRNAFLMGIMMRIVYIAQATLKMTLEPHFHPNSPKKVSS